MKHDDIKRLAREIGADVADVIALSPNNDPNYIGTPAHWALAEWFAELWEARGFAGLGGVHLRRFHYQILGSPKHDGKPYENTHADWQCLLNASRYARILKDEKGERLVDPEDLIDKHGEPPQIFLHRPPWHRDEPDFEVETAPMQLPSVAFDLVGMLDESLKPPEFATYGYLYDNFYQPYHIEVWAEKSTMNDILEPLCRRYNVNLNAGGKGFSTITAIIDLLGRMGEYDKPLRILYISDLDKAGKKMPVQVGTQGRYWMEDFLPNADIRLKPIVLTPEQAEEYGLSDLAILDPEMGEEKIELDALEALHPGELGNIVEREIMALRDTSLRERFWEARDEADAAVEEVLEEELGDELEELGQIRDEARPILTRYQHLLGRLSARMERELGDLPERLEEARQAIEDKASSLEPDLPERPESEIDDEDDDSWLFDARRDYLDQLKRYKTPEELARLYEKHKVCPECGTQFIAKRRDGVFCSRLCAQRVRRREKGRGPRG
jgi:ribosomal protein S27AE